MKKSSIFFLILFFVNFNLCLFSQVSKQFNIKKYTSENGLLSNLISDVNYDINGYMWIATQAGLSRFDGNEFLNYNSTNCPFIKSNRFIAIEKKSNGELIAVSQSYQLYKVDSLSKIHPIINYKYKKDFIISSNRKIINLNTNTVFAEYEINDYLNNGFILNTINSQSHYLIYSNYILFKSENKINQRYNLQNCYLSFVLNNKLCVITKDKQLYVFDNLNLICQIDLQNKLKQKFDINSLKITENNNSVSFNLNKKLYNVIDSNKCIEFVEFDFSLVDDEILYYVALKNSSTIILYTQHQGFFVLNRKIFNTFQNKKKSFKNQDTYRVLTNKNSEILNWDFFSKTTQLVDRFDEFNLWFNFKNQVYFMYKDTLINVKNGNSVSTKIEKEKGVNNHSVYTDLIECENKHYIILKNQILEFEDFKKLKLFINTPIDDISTACNIVNSNNWLIGSKDFGLFIYNKNSNEFKSVLFFRDIQVRLIKYDHSIKRYWVFTYGAGIYLLDDSLNVKAFFKDKMGFLSFTHYYLKDKYGNYWLPTNSGLFKLHESEVISFIKGFKKTLNYDYFDINDGLLNNEFNGRYTNSGIVLPNGNLAFSNMAGVVILNPQLMNSSTNKFPILFDQIFLNGNLIDKSTEIYAEEGFNNLKIKVSTPYYESNSYNYLEYLIPNLVNEWTPIDNNTLELLSLKQGEYKIYIRKKGDQNQSNYKTMVFIVTPPWYRSNFAFFIYFLLFVLSGYLISRYYFGIKQRKLKNELMLMESELKALRAQINPHYLSNSLMSLQSVVLDNDKEKAFEFIGQYGKVMRSILEKSDFSFIPLVQELQTLSEYTKLEGLIRNVNITFDYQFYSDNPIDNLNNIKVPTMIFQPFVENSILHGLMPNKNEFKQIQFKIRKIEKKLEVIITDNGIGFVKKNSERKSYGLENVQNRLKAYSKLLKVDAYFKIETINNESGLVSGTKVMIYMPYLFESENPII